MPMPYSVVNPTGKSHWLLVCEHASNQVPDYLAQLGLDDIYFDDHIAYDIGTQTMTLYLAEKLDATAIVANFSRLVVDCNRPLNHPECIPAVSDDIVIPGNQNLTSEQRKQRFDDFYLPFHSAVATVIADKVSRDPQLKLANIHSFTPELLSEQRSRPWHIGFVHRGDALSKAFIRYFKQHSDYCIGDNEPYNGHTHRGYTVPAHGDAQEIPSFLVEFRQDLIDSSSGVHHWGDLLLKAMNDLHRC